MANFRGKFPRLIQCLQVPSSKVVMKLKPFLRETNSSDSGHAAAMLGLLIEVMSLRFGGWRYWKGLCHPNNVSQSIKVYRTSRNENKQTQSVGPSRCKSTNRQNPPILQNRFNFQTNLHNCFNPLGMTSHCWPDLYNGICLLSQKF